MTTHIAKGRTATASDPEVVRLKRRRDSITAEELINWTRNRGWDVSADEIEFALDTMTETKTEI